MTTPPPSAPVDRSRREPSPVGLWLALVRGQTGLLARVVLCAVVTTALGLAMSFFLQILVDRVLVEGRVTALDVGALGMLGLMAFRALFVVLRQYLLLHVAQRIDLTLMLSYVAHLARLPLSFFRQWRIGEILSRFNDLHRVRALIGNVGIGLLLDGLTFLGAAAVLLVYHRVLTGLALLLLVPLFLLTLAMNRMIRRAELEQMEAAADVEAHLAESLATIGTLKAFAAEERMRLGNERASVRLMKSGFRSAMAGTALGAAGGLVHAIGGLMVLWYGGHEVIAGSLSLGQLMFFNSLVALLLGPVERMAEANAAWQDARMALARLAEILAIEPESGGGCGATGAQPVRGDLSVNDVRFSYGEDANALDGIDLHLPAGTTLGVVGASGSGKTTLAHLLMRFEDPTSGSILLDGIDLRDWDLGTLRSAVALIPQTVDLMHGTVRENLALGRPDAGMDEIVAAATEAGAHEFISRLPERYDTVVGERGASLSGGQRQRIAIARALLLRPRVLILDEATSNLDAEAQAAVEHMLRARAHDRTTIVIAHRLAMVRGADRIVVLRRGQIAEQGSHEHLLKAGGKYRQLWDRERDTGRGVRPRSQLPRREVA